MRLIYYILNLSNKLVSAVSSVEAFTSVNLVSFRNKVCV